MEMQPWMLALTCVGLGLGGWAIWERLNKITDMVCAEHYSNQRYRRQLSYAMREIEEAIIRADSIHYYDQIELDHDDAPTISPDAYAD